MTIPRRVVPGQNHMISRRCAERRFFLTPTKGVKQIVLYALAVAARRHGILVHAVIVESNHYHLNVTDVRGRLPEFQRDFDQLVARALNARLGRGEAFWCPGSYSNVEIHDEETLIEKLVYIYTNPVKDGLVATPEEWPGLRTLPEDMGTRVFTASKPKDAFFGGNKNSALTVYRDGVRRPLSARLAESAARRRLEKELRKRDRSKLPETVTLAISPPPLFEDSSLDEIHKRVRARLDACLRQIYSARRERGRRRFMGAQAVRDQDPFQSAGDTFPALKRDPRVACTRNARLRIQLLSALKAWREQYRLAYLSWKTGKRGVVFPFGTYGLRVLHSVRTGDSPAGFLAA